MPHTGLRAVTYTRTHVYEVTCSPTQTPWIGKGIVAFKKGMGEFPGGAVVKNPPANAGDMGSSPGPGRFHMPRSN